MYTKKYRLFLQFLYIDLMQPLQKILHFLIQIYCDYNRRIINVDPRWSGSVNDAYAFNCSPVGDLCKEGDMREDGKGPLGNFVLLADSGYV